MRKQAGENDRTRFCPKCGAQSTQGLNYCKQCGATLGQTAQGEPRKTQLAVIAMFLGAIVVVAILGLTMPLAVVSELIRRGASVDDAMKLALLIPGASVAIIASLVALLVRLVRSLPGIAEESQVAKRAAASREYPQIEARSESVGSVTEHTTREFRQSTYRESE